MTSAGRGRGAAGTAAVLHDSRSTLRSGRGQDPKTGTWGGGSRPTPWRDFEPTRPRRPSLPMRALGGGLEDSFEAGDSSPGRAPPSPVCSPEWHWARRRAGQEAETGAGRSGRNSLEESPAPPPGRLTLKSLPLRSTPRTNGSTPVASMAPFALPGRAKRGGGGRESRGLGHCRPRPFNPPPPGPGAKAESRPRAPARASPGTLQEALALSLRGFRPLRTSVSSSVQGLEGTRGVQVSRVLAQETS